MARTGRKRKSAVRHPSGRVVGETVTEIKQTATMQMLRDQITRESTNPLAQYPLGRAFLLRKITAEQHLAGARWAKSAFQFRAVSGFPQKAPRAMSMCPERGMAIDGPDVDDRAVEIVSRHNVARDALSRVGGAFRQVDMVCSDDKEPDDSKLLSKGLQILVDHWGASR